MLIRESTHGRSLKIEVFNSFFSFLWMEGTFFSDRWDRGGSSLWKWKKNPGNQTKFFLSSSCCCYCKSRDRNPASPTNTEENLFFFPISLTLFFFRFPISKVQKKIFATDDLRMNTDAQSGQSPARKKLLKLHFSFLFLSGKLGHVGPPGIRLRRIHRHGRGVLDVVHPKPHGHQHRQVWKIIFRDVFLDNTRNGGRYSPAL